MKIKWFGTVKQNKVILDDRKAFDACVCKLNDKRIELTISAYRKNRTTPQNKLYWKWIEIIANEVGEDDKDGLHNFFRAKFLIDKSKKLPIIKSTTQLTTKEFCGYMDKIERLVSQFGITLPHPDEVVFE